MIQSRALDKLRYAAADNAATPLAPFQAWAFAIGAGAAFFLIAFASIELTRYSDRIAPFWPANAVILVLLFRFRALQVRRVLASRRPGAGRCIP